MSHCSQEDPVSPAGVPERDGPGPCPLTSGPQQVGSPARLAGGRRTAARVTPTSPGPHRALSFSSHSRSGSASEMALSTQPSQPQHSPQAPEGPPRPLLPRWVLAALWPLTPAHLPEGSPRPHSCPPDLGLHRPCPSSLCPWAPPGCSGSHSRPGPSSHSAGAPGTASHTWRRQSAERRGGRQGRSGPEQPPPGAGGRSASLGSPLGSGADTSVDCPRVSRPHSFPRARDTCHHPLRDCSPPQQLRPKSSGAMRCLQHGGPPHGGRSVISIAPPRKAAYVLLLWAAPAGPGPLSSIFQFLWRVGIRPPYGGRGAWPASEPSRRGCPRPSQGIRECKSPFQQVSVRPSEPTVQS